MRLKGIVVVLSLLLIVQMAYSFVSTGHVGILGRVTTVDPAQLLTETNEIRAQSGLTELRQSDALNRAAALKAQDMFTNNYWSHSSPAGISPWKWLSDVGYSYSIAGENLAKNYPNAAATVSAWMESQAHRDNVLNRNYQEVGFAVSQGTIDGQETTLVVAYYGSPSTVAVQGANVVNIAPVTGGLGNIFTYFGSAVQSITPATLIAITVLSLMAIVAISAHYYRHELPSKWRKTWRAHHGMFTFTGAVCLVIVMVMATGGGQI